MSDHREKVDVVIVGLGATGGIAVGPLTQAGLKVVALEAGGSQFGTDYIADEVVNDVRNAWGSTKTNLEIPTLRSDSSDTAVEANPRLPMINAVGGTALHSPALYYRLLPWHFRERSETIERYGASKLPEGSSIVDWPFGYDELEPYYTKVEELLGVSGKAGNLGGKIIPGGNPFEAPRSKEYPLPPLRKSGFGRLMHDAAENLGWHPYTCAAGLRSQPYRGLNECTYCGFCTFNDCWRGAKGVVSLSGVPEAVESGHLEIVTHARATKIETGSDGMATGVTYVKDSETVFQPAAVVILATFTYENTRLLLLSRSDAHPSGLGNSSDQVGRHLMLHNISVVRGLFPGLEMNTYSGPTSQATTLDDWEADNFDHSELPFIGGSTIHASNELKPISMARGVPPSVPKWGSQWKAFLKKNGRSVGEAYIELEQLSYPDHRIDLDPSTTDAFGVPRARLTTRYRDSDRDAFEYLISRVKQWFEAAGATETWVPNLYGLLAVQPHAFGTTRIGEDPSTSVLDHTARLHDAQNVAVVGACTMPTSAGRNPTLTAQALAWRTAEKIVSDWDEIAR